MVRRIAGRPAAESMVLPAAAGGSSQRGSTGAHEAGVVVNGGALAGSPSRSAQPGRRGAHERTRSRRRQLGLAVHRRDACAVGLPMAAGLDGNIQPLLRSLTESIVSKNERGIAMKATQKLHDLGQSLWLDNITRDLLQSGSLKRYINELAVTGLTSNPTIFDHAIKNSSAYDLAIRKLLSKGKSGEQLFFELALEDITGAADLFRPLWERTDGVDGWASLEVSPLLARDTARTLAAAKDLHARAGRPNVFIKIPGTEEGLPAIEEAIFSGVSVNVTLLFSREQYAAAAEAFLRGIERRIDAGLKPELGSVASVFVSRWDGAVTGKVADSLKNRLGISIAMRTYKAYRDLLASPRWQRVFNAGARPQRLLWASTGTKDPTASD